MSEEKDPVEEKEKTDDNSAEETPAEATAEATEEADEAAEKTPAEADSTPEVEDEPEEEPNELSKPAVIDIKEMLIPIAGESPAGEYLRYDGIYDEIGEARKADDQLNRGAWQEELKTADFKKVIDLAVPVLKSRSKDIQIAAWLAEALTAEHGFAGLRDSLRLVRLMMVKFWDSFYPEVDEGDEEGRANALAWIDREAGQIIKDAALTVDGWGYNGFLDSKKFLVPDNIESLSSDEQVKISALREKAEKEGRATEAQWNQAVAKTKRAFCEEIEVAIDECIEEYKKLNEAIEKSFDRNQAPSLPDLRKALDDIKGQADKLLDQKRLEEPDPADHEDTEDADGDLSGNSGNKGMSGAIRNRADALRRLSQVAAFFKTTEPHSPVSYLVNRAVSWGSMPLETWLQDVIKDQNILAQLRQTLGFNTSADSDEAEGSETEAPPQVSGSLQ